MFLSKAVRALAVPAALIAFSHIAAAQAKVVVVNLQRAVLESAEIKAAGAAMEATYKPRLTEVEALEKEVASIQQKLNDPSKLTPQTEADLQAQGTRKQRDAQRKREDLQAEVDAERNAILQRSSQKVTDVLKKLAEEKGYDIVVDASATPYFKAATEITSELIVAYDKAYPAAKK
jgi:outer membrane protein